MPSNSLTAWLTHRAAKLDELEAAHQAVGGSAPGRRYATHGGQLVRVMLETADPDDAKDVEVAARDVEALEKNTKRADRGTPRLAPSH